MSKVKICGISRIEDINVINRVLPDYIGFVFAPSRRRVDVKTAAKMKENLDLRVETVGVFVNEDIEAAAEIYNSGIIELIQLHGSEDSLYIKRLRECCGARVIQAVSVIDSLPSPLPDEPDYLMFDTFSERRGGAGRAFDWRILKGRHGGLPYFLAGGLTADNVVDSIRLLDPYCVDVSSGVETDGLKDAEKIERFVYLAKGGI